MRYKIYVDTKNGDRFDFEVASEEEAKATMEKVNFAIEEKHPIVSLYDGDHNPVCFLVEMIMSWSYSPIAKTFGVF